MASTLPRSLNSGEIPMSGPGKGKVGLYVEVPPEVAESFKAYAKSRGEKLGEAVARALRREMISPPPPVTDAPFPPMESPKEKRKKK